jgi:hypothetical protein
LLSMHTASGSAVSQEGGLNKSDSILNQVNIVVIFE